MYTILLNISFFNVRCIGTLNISFVVRLSNICDAYFLQYHIMCVYVLFWHFSLYDLDFFSFSFLFTHLMWERFVQKLRDFYARAVQMKAEFYLYFTNLEIWKKSEHAS